MASSTQPQVATSSAPTRVGVGHDEATRSQRSHAIDHVPQPKDDQQHPDADDHREPARPAVPTTAPHAFSHRHPSLRGRGLHGGRGIPVEDAQCPDHEDVQRDDQ